MNENRKKSLFESIKEGLSRYGLFAPFFATALPSDPNKVLFSEGVPSGLRLLHTADTIPEAEMLSQILHEEGFPIEYVPTAGAGIFGIQGNRTIYVREDAFDTADAFLSEYLSGKVESPEGTEEAPPPEE